MEANDLKGLEKLFKQYSERDGDKFYFHKEWDDFKIMITKDGEVYQLNTDHEGWGIELQSHELLRVRFESFTGELVYNITTTYWDCE